MAHKRNRRNVLAPRNGDQLWWVMRSVVVPIVVAVITSLLEKR